MTPEAKVLLAVLSVAVVTLTIGLVAALARDDDPQPRMRSGTNSYAGMIDAFGRMDADDLLEHMRRILGPEAYEAMVAHMTEHRSGAAGPHRADLDGMMHMMMDGMMQEMPADGNDVMPGVPR